MTDVSMQGCPPNCYAKVVEAVTTVQHEATQEKLDAIIGNQNKIDGSVRGVAEAIIKLGAIEDRFSQHQKEADAHFNKIYELFRTQAEKIALKADIAALDALKGKGESRLFEIIKLLMAAGIGGLIGGKL